MSESLKCGRKEKRSSIYAEKCPVSQLNNMGWLIKAKTVTEVHTTITNKMKI